LPGTQTVPEGLFEILNDGAVRRAEGTAHLALRIHRTEVF
jgi:hypothetical protein